MRARLEVIVDEVVTGYPEQILPRSTVYIEWELEPRGFPPVDSERLEELLNELEVGGRYFFSSLFTRKRGITGDVPRCDFPSYFAMRSIIREGELLAQCYDFWYIPMPKGELVDWSDPALALAIADIEFQRRMQHKIYITSTMDMTAIPFRGRPAINMRRLTEGRLLNYDDYLAARPVVVINRILAWYRDISIGDKITISFENSQFAEVWAGLTDQNNIVRVEELQNFGGYEAHFLHSQRELEVVGIIENHSIGRPPLCDNMIMVVPDSIMPEDISQSTMYRIYITLPDTPEFPFLYTYNYSFVLNSIRDRQAFLDETGAILAELGYEIYFVETNVENFWASIEPVQMATAINRGMFGVLFVLVLVLITFLYLHTRRKEIAIARALGNKRGGVIGQTVSPILLVWVPFVIAGSIVAYYFALEQATPVLQPIGEAIAEDGIEVMVNLPIRWLVMNIALVVFVMILLVFLGALYLANRPVLELLQGIAGTEQKGTRADTRGTRADTRGTRTDTRGIGADARITQVDVRESIVDVKRAKVGARREPKKTKEMILQELASLLEVTDKAETDRAVADRGRNSFVPSWRFIKHHVIRSKAKSVLVIIVFSFFVLALAWLGETIEQGEEAINRLYDTTVVTVDIIQEDPSEIPACLAGGFIRKRVINGIRETGFAKGEYLEAGYMRSFIHRNRSADIPEYFLESLERAMSFFDPKALAPLFGVSCVTTLLAEPGSLLEIHYAPGYDEDAF